MRSNDRGSKRVLEFIYGSLACTIESSLLTILLAALSNLMRHLDLHFAHMVTFEDREPSVPFSAPSVPPSTGQPWRWSQGHRGFYDNPILLCGHSCCYVSPRSLTDPGQEWGCLDHPFRKWVHLSYTTEAHLQFTTCVLHESLMWLS